MPPFTTPPLLAPAAERLAAALRRSPLYEPVRERLRPFAGKTLRVDVAGLGMGFVVGDDGDLHVANDGSPDLHMDIPPERLLRRALGDGSAFEGLAFTGDAAMAQALSAIARDFYWDWPTALESVLPPPVAAPLGLMAARMRAAWQETGQRAGAVARDFLRNESGMVTPGEMHSFLQGVDELREAVDRLQARVDRLQRKA
jgi:ubiquinone biosynthesis protein UbiJ